jgi:hypothetical protein
MKGLIWDCRGIKKKGVSSFLRNLILEHKFHFVGLQETMQQCIEDKKSERLILNRTTSGNGPPQGENLGEC